LIAIDYEDTLSAAALGEGDTPLAEGARFGREAFDRQAQGDSEWVAKLDRLLGAVN
jgi:hypothetical protein